MSKKRSKAFEREEDIGDFLEQITPFVETLAPNIVQFQKNKVPLIKRTQLLNFLIMSIIILSVVLLAVTQIIDGSAATGLIGAIIGYVFGGLFSKESK